MTQAPTPGPLSGDDVKLLKRGDMLRFNDALLCSYEHGQDEEKICVIFDPTMDGYRAVPFAACSFIGRPDADGWIPWAGGENPVRDHSTEVQFEDGHTLKYDPGQPITPEMLSHGPIIAFRLAPTAPVEASGSERALQDAVDFGVGFLVDGQRVSPERVTVCHGDSSPLRPQPSGETRSDFTPVGGLWKDQSLSRMERVRAHRFEFDSDVSAAVEAVDEEASRQALLSARPLALGGQQGAAAGCAESEVGRAIYERIEKLIDAKPGTPECDELSFLAFLVESVEEVGGYDGPPASISAPPTPARAEAQDEGAAGERDRLVAALADALAFIDDMGTDLHHARVADWYPEGANNAAVQMSEDMRLAGNRCATYEPLVDLNEIGSAHPSPTPAADPVSIVPPHCTGLALSFEPGVLHVSKDGSGYIAVDEKHFELEDDRFEGPDGPEGSIHWITRLDASEVVALRDFLTGATPAADDDRVRIAVEALELAAVRFDEIYEAATVDDVAYRNEATIHGINGNADVAQSEVREALAALKSEGK